MSFFFFGGGGSPILPNSVYSIQHQNFHSFPPHQTDWIISLLLQNHWWHYHCYWIKFRLLSIVFQASHDLAPAGFSYFVPHHVFYLSRLLTLTPWTYCAFSRHCFCSCRKHRWKHILSPLSVAYQIIHLLNTAAVSLLPKSLTIFSFSQLW